MAKRKNKQVQNVPENPATYFLQRMQDLGITNTGDHGFTYESLEYPGSYAFIPLFAETPGGDIQINYPCLYGGPEHIDKTETDFFRIRYNPEKGKADKYFQEPGSGKHIFFPIPIIEKFSKKEKIQTLFIVEGEFKAFAGSQHGIDIVGIGGKDLFADGEGQLHEDILAIINACNVENLVLLLDADVHALYWDPELEPDRDLAKRPRGFYNTVKRFREMAKGRVRDVYFMHLRDDLLKNAKGLDDLLLYRRGDEHIIVADLLRLKSARAFFEGENISSETLTYIKKVFKLNIYKGAPYSFHAHHYDLIGDHEFNFNGARYKWDRSNEVLNITKHFDSDKFKRIGCDFFKEIQVPDERGHLNRKLIGWKAGEIQRDYINGLGIKNFFSTIEKFEAMCNVPENDPEKYQQVIEGCYNVYFKLTHSPAEGKFPNTEQFLKHIFGERKLISGHTNYDLALDWLTILYTQPTMKLPAVCLVSKEKKTGKSTFLWWLREIFNENATVIGNQEISDQYNDDFITKLVIGIDESFIDKRLIIEKIKSQITNPKGKLHGKYISRQDVPFVGKYVMTSNLEDNFIMIDDDENRFWINKVPVFPENKQDPDLLEKMTAEIPAFIHFLNTRTILHPRTDRLWFNSKLLETEAAKAVKISSQDWLEKEIRETFEDLFFMYEYHTLYYTISEIMHMLNGPDAGVKFRKSAVAEKLKKTFGYHSINGRFDQPDKPEESAITKEKAPKTFTEKKGRCYEFRIEDFIPMERLEKQFNYYTPDEIAQYRETVQTYDGVVEDDLPF